MDAKRRFGERDDAATQGREAGPSKQGYATARLPGKEKAGARLPHSTILPN